MLFLHVPLQILANNAISVRLQEPMKVAAPLVMDENGADGGRATAGECALGGAQQERGVAIRQGSVALGQGGYRTKGVWLPGKGSMALGQGGAC